jgi:cell division protein FtsA
MSQKQENLIVVLDVGSAFTRVLAADLNEGALRYRAHSVVESAGMRKGLIAELGPAARAVKAASDQTERLVNVNTDECMVGVGGPNVLGVNTTAGLNFGSRMREISKDDVIIAVERARAVSLPPDREILHLLTRQFVLDDQPGIHDPVGMVGSRLEVDLHMSTCSGSAQQSVVTCANRAGLEVTDTVFEAIAAAEATLTADERELGVCVLDIGAHSTELVVFFEGAVAHTGSIPFGGQHFTNDLAVVLQVPVAHAEDLKRRHGHAVVTAIPQLDEIEIRNPDPTPGMRTIRKRMIAEILEPRARELFDMVRRSLRDGGVLGALGAGCVLTGGASILPGLLDVTESILHVRARIGQPVQLSRMPAELTHPSYSTLVGMMLYAHRKQMTRTAENNSLRGKLRAIFAASL